MTGRQLRCGCSTNRSIRPRTSRIVVPWYYTQTLTDASRNYYDLCRLHGGAIEKGRFGRALRIRGSAVSPGMGLASNYASEPRTYGVFLPADHDFVPGSAKEKESIANYFWYTSRPDRVFDALQGKEWTVELWLRTNKQPPDTLCLIDAGQGTETLLRLELTNTARTCRIMTPEAKESVEIPLSHRALADGDWHHLAVVRPKDQSMTELFIDGKRVGATEFKLMVTKANPTRHPGLVMRTFGELEFDRAIDVSTGISPGKNLEPKLAGAKSVRLRGWVKAPASGNIRFETDANSGLHLDVDDRPLVYGWFGRAAMYRRSPRWGTLPMNDGELYPVMVEIQQGEQDPALAAQKLYWSWPGHAKEPVPASAWAHTDDDVRAAREDSGGDFFSPTQLMKRRFNLVLGSTRGGADALDGWIDELRISSIARYTTNFTPATHSLNYGPDAPPPARPTGPTPLFGDTATADPLPLGSRKHVFIDDALLERSRGLEFVVNRPRGPQTLTPELPKGDHSFFDLNGDVALFAPSGYEGREDFANLWVSKDGIHFRLHDALTVPAGAKPRPIKTGMPAWGRMAIDDNPDTPGWAKFKYTAGVPHRGIFLLVSPDAIHWRRNETIMLQVGTGGESHWYWDDQLGEYRYLLKWDHGPGGRQSVEAVTKRVFEPWPLAKDGRESDLATPLGFMPALFPPDKKLGEVYRSRDVKYLWAPDVYLAFLWRFDRETKARQVELAVSRDGTRWTYFHDNWYMPAEFEYNGQQIHEVTSVDGMILRGDQIWQYADYSTGRHDGSLPSWRVRLTQRLDGFVSLDARAKEGEFLTKPFTFSGNTLILNAEIENQGTLQAALVDANGTTLPGCSFEDCEPVRGDSTHLRVNWKSKHDLSEFAGKPVRLKVRMRDTKLYALQFE